MHDGTFVLDRRGALAGIGATIALPLAACSCARASRPEAAKVRPDLYNCDGCEATIERGPEGLSSSLQLAPISEPGQRLTLTGVVRHWDSKLPASNVVIYAHQTNAEGL